MSAYAALTLAILFEVTGTLLLPISAQFTKIIPTVILSALYILSFYFLTIALKEIPLAIVYACWSGLGVFLIAIHSYNLYSQTLSWQSILGLFLIVNGVILVNAYGGH